jgi:hypothetical protein
MTIVEEVEPPGHAHRVNYLNCIEFAPTLTFQFVNPKKLASNLRAINPKIPSMRYVATSFELISFPLFPLPAGIAP